MISTLLAQQGNPAVPSVFAYVVLVVFFAVFLGSLIACVFMAKYFTPWIQARMIGFHISIFEIAARERSARKALAEMTGADVGLSETPRLDRLIGQFGRAVTPMGPSGLAEFGGQRFAGLAEDGEIAPGVPVRAVGARDGQLVVRSATGSDERLT